MLDSLIEHYQEYSWTDLDYSFDPQNYYILKENNEILAGMQVKEFCWTIENLPGISGKIIVNTFHRLPVLKELFNPRNYQFLKIGNIYVKKGFEKKLIGLIEAVLVLKGLKTCITYINTKTNQDQLIAKLLQSGLLSSSSLEVKVFVKGNDPQANLWSEHEPLFISISDSI